MKEKFSKWYLRPNWIFKVFALIFSVCFCASFAVDMNCCMRIPYKALEEDFIKDNKNYVQLSKKGNGWNTCYFNEDEVNDIEKNTNTSFLKCYPMNIYLTDSNSSNFINKDIFSRVYEDGICVSSLNSLPSSYTVLEGKLPEGDKEIMLTDFQYCFFKYNGYSYNEETILPQEMSMKTLIGKTLRCSFSSIGRVIISGFLDTGFDYEHSDDYVQEYEENNDNSMLMNRLSDKYIISDKLIKPIIDNNNIFLYNPDNTDSSIPMSRFTIKNDKIGETYSSPYITLLNDLSLNRAMRINENVQDEILLPVSYFESMLYEDNAVKRTIIIPKEFIYDATDDSEKNMTLSKLFDNYLEYAVSYYAEENYAEIYTKNLSFMEKYGKYYFNTQNPKPVDEWSDEEKKEVLKLYLSRNYEYKKSDEYFSDDANAFIVSYSKKYLKYFYDQYEKEIFQGDKIIQVEKHGTEFIPFTFNGFNLDKRDFNVNPNDSLLVNEEGMKKLSVYAGNYYSFLIARTEDINIDAVFSYIYSKKNRLPYYNGSRLNVKNVTKDIRLYEAYIDEYKETVTKIVIISAVLALAFIILDAFFIKRKNEKKVYLIASGENAKEECIKTAMFPSLLSMILIWPLSIILYACSMPILNNHSKVYIPFYPINVLYLFLISLVVCAISFTSLYLILDKMRRIHEKAMQIKKKRTE